MHELVDAGLYNYRCGDPGCTWTWSHLGFGDPDVVASDVWHAGHVTITTVRARYAERYAIEPFDRWLDTERQAAVLKYMREKETPVIRIELAEHLQVVLDAAVKQARADAWDEGIDDYLKFKSFGHDIGRPTNPYRSE